MDNGIKARAGIRAKTKARIGAKTRARIRARVRRVRVKSEG